MFLWFTMSPVCKTDQLSKQTRREMNSSSAKPLQNLSKLRTASSATAETWWLFYTRKAETWQEFQATSESWISFDPSSCRQIRCSSLTSFLSNYIRILADHHGQWQPSYKKTISEVIWQHPSCFLWPHLNFLATCSSCHPHADPSTPSPNVSTPLECNLTAFFTCCTH